MSKTIIKTDKAPAAIGPYSQATAANGIMFVSGQIPLDPETGELVKGDIKAAAHMCLKNVKAILEEAGSGLDNVLKTVVYLKSMDDFAAVNEVYAQYFTGDYPARACFAVAALPKDADVEIEAIASL